MSWNSNWIGHTPQDVEVSLSDRKLNSIQSWNMGVSLNRQVTLADVFILFISPLFNQVGKLRTSSHLQLRPGQDKAKEFDTYNDTELHME